MNTNVTVLNRLFIKNKLMATLDSHWPHGAPVLLQGPTGHASPAYLPSPPSALVNPPFVRLNLPQFAPQSKLNQTRTAAGFRG